ncbi:DEAD/DEAH box helicase [bacterium]|nr:MAG: DEAD/DEAH box helicase [bacterium]
MLALLFKVGVKYRDSNVMTFWTKSLNINLQLNIRTIVLLNILVAGSELKFNRPYSKYKFKLIDIKNLITRLDEQAFQNILGKEVIGTLNLLGGKYVYSENLLKVLFNTYSTQELLIKKVSRNYLIDAMSNNEINNLVSLLEVRPIGNIYNYVKEVNFKGEIQEKLFEFFGEKLSKESPLEWISEVSILPKYPLYSYQINVQRKINKYLSTEKNRVLLHMPTGSGKTRTAISYICRYFLENNYSNVIWFANTKELLDQAFSEFVKAWTLLGDREIKAVKYWDKSTVDLTMLKGCFIVAGLDKTYQALMKNVGAISIFAGNCGLVIMDEAHMAIAPTYKLLIENMVINNASLIGLSATPGRTWNNPEEDKRLSSFFYRQKAKLEIPGYDNPVDYLVEEGYLAKVNNTKLFTNSGITLSPVDIKYLSDNYVLPMNILKDLSENRLRNMAIITKVKELVKVHKRIILFAITKDHAIVLNSLLTALEINSNVVTSETNSNDRANIIQKFKQTRAEYSESIVLCNFGILTTGFDAPETSCAVIARPTDSLVLYSQMVGRAIRGIKSGGNETAEIVTVIDESLPGFKEVADAFLNWEDVWEKEVKRKET